MAAGGRLLDSEGVDNFTSNFERTRSGSRGTKPALTNLAFTLSGVKTLVYAA